MKSLLVDTLIAVFTCALLLALVGGEVEAAPVGSSITYSAEALQRLLSTTPAAPPIPELETADPAALASAEYAKVVIDWINEAPSEVPATTYTLYRRFRVSGERYGYQDPSIEKRRLLTRHALGVWLGLGESHLADCNDLIWSICEETTWVLPAHENSAPWNIDLFAAETAVELAHVLLLLADRLPEEVRQRVQSEVKGRVLDPYLSHAHDYWWNRGSNNWTGVCAGSIGQTFLLLEPDVDRQAQALQLVLEQLERFLDKAFGEDGVSLEGIRYWNFGLSHLVEFAEMLNVRTGGAIDLLAHEKLEAIAQYPAVAAVGKRAFAAFADSDEASEVLAFLASRLAARTGVQALLDQAGDAKPDGAIDWRCTTVLRNLLWWPGETGASPRIEDAYLPGSGIIKVTGRAAEKPVVLVAKAGHNAEPHNNNDVGSFILRIGGVTYLCDPGKGLYSRDYFGPKRYENVFANSYGHSVPRIGGRLQKAGSEYAGVLEKQGEKAFRIALEKAYPIPNLTKAERTLALHDDGSLQMTADYAFKDGGLEVEEAFITWLDVEVEEGAARIRSAEGTLEIRADEGVFGVERLEEACKANHKEGVLSRITLAAPPSSKIHRRYSIVFRPR